MINNVFFSFDPVTFIATITNTALWGAIIFLIVDFLRKKSGRKNKDDK